MSPDLPSAHTQPPAPDPWSGLRAFTAARIALGRVGTSVPLQEALAFRLAHAAARDAVYSALEVEKLTTGLAQLSVRVCVVRSQAENRPQYLQRPDLGRRLHPASRELLLGHSMAPSDVAVILADGLSAAAVQQHALPVLQLLLPKLQAAGFRLAPVVVAEQARVAISDEIGQVLQAQLALILIGERPGLSSPHSLGAYFTYGPRPGLTDEARNCVSNIRPEGLSYALAADKLFFLLQEALRRQLSGVLLKDEMGLLDA
ncbi:Ethanolamine ammonia-lyase light chain [Hymenobacter gelipurpurascens]|uniref:Ethanolamine ammonia-lyase small subunit n=1 Tax=Hymenobacter gelipurpurascens TaxID=89968 RepID=A0A212UEB3_9BACT|nr:ethanolamine ammonia-lyase subunit EutC [Hymenobacter gelipurpurascens]SNC76577.1 Ethanolamine ammonia-lyase light chain [Hymenobacter gelipurpurascens]